jgi:predicted AlkP superfamily pyrophosphatase or phosphodiesterase
MNAFRKVYLPLLVMTALAWMGCSKSAQGPQNRNTPKLVVFISIDQFRYDYLTRYRPYFGPDGFNYLIENGADFVDCHYGHATTETAVGHAIMMSGTYPYKSGIVANEWFDREIGRRVYAVEDTSTSILGIGNQSKTDGRSPRNFQGTNLGDQLKLVTGGAAKVFGVSNKDRAAILMAGKLANAAYWMDDREGKVVTSSYYMSEFPQWMNDYNATKPLDKWRDSSWTLLREEKIYPVIPEKYLNNYTESYGMGLSFPHKPAAAADYYKSLIRTPFGSQALLSLAKEVTVKENLGMDGVPDILCISFSPNDYIGHQFGPMSREAMDISLRTDGYIAELIKFIDKRVGLNDVLFVLTADHGSTPIPEEMKDKNIDAGRISIQAVYKIVNGAMTDKYGKLATERSYVDTVLEPSVYFNPRALKEKKIDKNECEDYISAFLLKKTESVFRVYKSSDLALGNVSHDAITGQVEKNFFPARVGDLVIVLKPFHIWSYGKGTGHGQPYSYDTHVPLILCGQKWIKSGTFGDRCSPADIAPTLAAILEIEYPSGCDGKILKEVIKSMR